MKTQNKKTSVKIRKKKSESEPLTLEVLDKYTQKVLLPALDKNFATKKEFNNIFLANQKLMLKKLDILLS